MADTPLFTLDAEGRWRLACDRQQWVIQRRKGSKRPVNGSGIADSGWRAVSFIGSVKRVLSRCIREAGVVLAPEAETRLDALPEQFLDFVAERKRIDRDVADSPGPGRGHTGATRPSDGLDYLPAVDGAQRAVFGALESAP